MHDNALTQLQRAVDPQAMAAAFEEFFSGQYPGRGLKVNECQISRVHHRPGKNCLITYRLFGHDGENRPYDQWFFAQMPGNGETKVQPRNVPPIELPSDDFWKPVSAWQEMNMVLHAFPFDPKMPYLAQLLSREFVKRQIENRRSSFDLPEGWECRDLTCYKIKYMPGRRCVLRYELIMSNADSRRMITFYSKTYNSAKSGYVYEVLQKVCASPACANGLLNIPAPIAHLESANTLWQHAWEGKKFGAVMRECGWANLPGSGFVPKIAAMLAALHQVEILEPALAAGPTRAMVIENAHGDAGDITQFLPEKQAALQAIVKTLETFDFETDSVPQATIHGSFKVAQLLCRERELALVDFDSIAHGDPLYDVAEFVASILFLIISDGIPAAPMRESVEAFLSGYQEQVPWACDRRRLAWYLVAFLLGKMHSSLKRFETRAVKNMPLAFDLVEEWLEVVKREA